MQISWFLRADTKTCEWTFHLNEGTFVTLMPLEQFFALIDQLGPMCQQLKSMMNSGMDASAAIAEWERMIKENAKKSVEQPKATAKERYLRNASGGIIGQLDRDYDLVDGRVVFDEVVLKGDWGDEKIWFNGVALKVESVRSQTGLLVDSKGMRGPVLQGVSCKVA